MKAAFREALDNDLNTSLAVTALYDALKADATPATKLAAVADFDTVLCLDLIKKAEKKANEAQYDESDPFIAEILEAIKNRAQAKKEKNYAEADRIRGELLAKGVELTDTKEGTTFKLL